MHQSSKIYRWDALNPGLPARYIIENVTTEWQTLLDNENLKERDYHRFLVEHAGFFFFPIRQPGIVISKLRLRSEPGWRYEYETDFVVGVDQNSMGFSYELIEIETPHVPAIRKGGDYASRLTHAVRQILDWQVLTEKKLKAVENWFPHVSKFKYTIYIGRRCDEEQHNRRRDWFADHLKIEIRSFDALTDQLKRRFFDFQPYDCTERASLSKVTQNQIMNPFFMAYSFRDWTQLRKQLPGHSHVVIQNAGRLLEFRKYNAKFKEFIRFSQQDFDRRPTLPGALGNTL